MVLRHEGAHWRRCRSGLVHTVVTTPANEADVKPDRSAAAREGKTVFGDAGYTGADKRAALQGRKVDLAHRR